MDLHGRPRDSVANTERANEMLAGHPSGLPFFFASDERYGPRHPEPDVPSVGRGTGELPAPCERYQASHMLAGSSTCAVFF